MLLKTSLAAGMTLIASVMLNSNNACADEGMWQPPQLPSLAGQLEQRGLALDPRQLSTLTSWPLDAVVSLGFCTASFVSPDGLVVTNHHCGYFALQYNSTPQKNLINDGFLARTKGDELPADPTQRVYVTEQISDVTQQINAALNPDMDGYARYVAIDQAKKRLVQGCEQPGYRCDVYTFSGGYDYQLIRQKELRDIRLVYAPPLSIGKYGGDVDNWMWPRHTGDFSFLRAYVAKDGSSASYSKDNVPYRPKHWLTVNPKGVGAGDFAQVEPIGAIAHRLDTKEIFVGRRIEDKKIKRRLCCHRERRVEWMVGGGWPVDACEAIPSDEVIVLHDVAQTGASPQSFQ